MLLTINETIVSRFKAENLSIEYIGTIMFVLCLMYEQNYRMLDSMDDDNRSQRMVILYQYLNRMKFIQPAPAGSDFNYELTPKGVEFAKFIEAQDENTSLKVEPILAIAKKANLDVKSWIKEYIEIFPAGKFHGRYLRSDDCVDRMEWFMSEYEYDKDTILAATKAYISNQEEESDGHKYTQNCTYFILKGRHKSDRKSTLATWCRIVLDGEVVDNEYIQRDVV